MMQLVAILFIMHTHGSELIRDGAASSQQQPIQNLKRREQYEY